MNVVDRYGDPIDEYNAVRTQAGIIDLSNRGRIEVSGKNRVQFLQGLVSNDIKALKLGQGVFAAFLNVTGRVLADCFIHALADSFLIDTAPGTRQKVFNNLDKFSPAGDFHVTDLTEATSLLALQGPQSAKHLSDLGATVYNLNELQHSESEIAGRKLIVIKNSRTGEEGFDLFVSNENIDPVFKALVDGGATPVGLTAFNLLRLEAGHPEYGIDMDENIILLEAGLEKAVSYTKGCYLGQETIAKIHHRGHNQTAKRLAGLIIEDQTVPPSGAKIYNKENKEIGRITSAVFSPAFNQPIALAYLKRNNFEPGMEHTIDADGQKMIARVIELPFYRKAAV
jgi:tRNA-modifying protein YgfZ